MYSLKSEHYMLIKNWFIELDITWIIKRLFFDFVFLFGVLTLLNTIWFIKSVAIFLWYSQLSWKSQKNVLKFLGHLGKSQHYTISSNWYFNFYWIIKIRLISKQNCSSISFIVLVNSNFFVCLTWFVFLFDVI